MTEGVDTIHIFKISIMIALDIFFFENLPNTSFVKAIYREGMFSMYLL